MNLKNFLFLWRNLSQMLTQHLIHIAPAERLKELQNDSVDLVVTSPPYPMVEMWDEILATQNDAIKTALADENGPLAFGLMHTFLNQIWQEVARVTKKGGFVCVNIGDATRTIGGEFQLYVNHAQIVQFFTQNGFSCLPAIIWRKPTNAPNKFMGSGMLPAGAYITLEHEYILVFRKGGKRVFKSDKEKLSRQRSAYFWEERNQWFSDLWEIRGTQQKLSSTHTRERSGAYPLEIPYRLINMYSCQGDTVLDPFLGTGTTAVAAALTGRNSVGYEIDSNLKEVIFEELNPKNISKINDKIKARLQAHRDFVQKRLAETGNPLKHFNRHHQFPVMTSQETELTLHLIKEIRHESDKITVAYESFGSL
ncbi:MAG: site-specific DNA-methyltransferase [Spirosomaceae bacterium]|nr:site-specific DNA-methyltransferase [Spirosomataceae bacterium]